jgi:ankyrin repeat protein
MHFVATQAQIATGRDAFSHNIVTNHHLNLTNNVYTESIGRDEPPKNVQMSRLFRSQSTDYIVNHIAAISSRTPGTGRWFLDSQMYKLWKNGGVSRLACVGIPGAGKTIMAAIIIEDLENSLDPLLPQVVLMVYNKYNSQRYQTTRLVMLNLLSQVMEHHQPSSSQVVRLYKAYNLRPDLLPRHDHVKAALKQELQPFGRIYVVVDALDEFDTEQPARCVELIREVEDLGASVLVTSRTHIPFTPGTFTQCEIRASSTDVETYIDARISAGTVASVLKRDLLLARQVATTISSRADGMFLCSHLALQSIVDCTTPYEVKLHLSKCPSTLDQTYDTIMERIHSQQDPRARRLISSLVITEGKSIGVEAMMQSISSIAGLEGDVRDHVPDPQVVLSACYGLVIVVDQYNNEHMRAKMWEDKEMELERQLREGGYFRKAFQLCHLSLKEYFQNKKHEAYLSRARTELVYSWLRYMPSILPALIQTVSISTSTNFTKLYCGLHYPLLFHAISGWTAYAHEIPENEADHSVFRAFFDSLPPIWLINRLKYNTRCKTVASFYASALSKAGLANILTFFFKWGRPHMEEFGTKYTSTESTLPVVAVVNRDEHISNPSDDLLHLADLRGRTPLSIAAEKGHHDAAAVILSSHPSSTANYVDRGGSTPLLYASRLGHDPLVSLLIDRGADVDLADNDGCTPLIAASVQNHDNVVLLLTGAKAVIDVGDKDGCTPLIFAAMTPPNGNPVIASILLDNGAAVDLADSLGRTPLIHAASRGHSDIATVLLDRGALIDVGDDEGQTSLIHASISGHTETITLLLRRGAAIDLANDEGATPLIHAVVNEQVEVAVLLLEEGADVDLTDEEGWSPLIHAVTFEDPTIPALLLDHRAVLDHQDEFGCTPLMHASMLGHVEVVALLLQRGASIDLADKKGLTPLLYAVTRNRAAVVTFLLDHGASVELADVMGFTPLRYAFMQEERRIVGLLRDKGASIPRALYPVMVNQIGSATNMYAALTTGS